MLKLSSSPSGDTSPTLGRGNQYGTTAFLKLLLFENNVGVVKQDNVYYNCEFSLETDLARGRAQVAPRGDGECSFCGLWPHLPSTYQCTAWHALVKGKVPANSPADGVQK